MGLLAGTPTDFLIHTKGKNSMFWLWYVENMSICRICNKVFGYTFNFGLRIREPSDYEYWSWRLG